jgi:hypothetical protein
MSEAVFSCDKCGDEATYELIERVAGSDIYAVTGRYCAECAGVLSDADEDDEDE